MIGSWMLLCLFFRCCIQLERGKEGKINYGGFPPSGVFSRQGAFSFLG
jgi:hypothetical protein